MRSIPENPMTLQVGQVKILFRQLFLKHWDILQYIDLGAGQIRVTFFNSLYIRV
jgi:hypothetical protein